jgi:DNA-binding MarR family transcriptional regulator
LLRKKRSEHSITAKWGEGLSGVAQWRREGLGGFVPVVRSFLRLYSQVGLSPTEAMFVLHLMDSKWDTNHPTVRTKILAERMNVSVPQLKRYIRSLESKGMKTHYVASKRWHVFDMSALFVQFEEAAQKARQVRRRQVGNADAPEEE